MIRVMAGIILAMLILCGFLYYSLSSTKEELLSSEESMVEMRQLLQGCQEAAQKAQFLREKHEEIIAELFLDQDTTMSKFEDLEAKFQALRGSRGCPRGVVSEKGNSGGVDLSSHERLLSEAACLAGAASACSSPTTPAE